MQVWWLRSVRHDHRNCPVPNLRAPRVPAQKQDANQDSVEEGPQPPPQVATIVQDVSLVNWDWVLYVVFDLETTGCSW